MVNSTEEFNFNLFHFKSLNLNLNLNSHMWVVPPYHKGNWKAQSPSLVSVVLVNVTDLNWIPLLFCDTEPLFQSAINTNLQVTCIPTFIVSSSSERVRRGVVRESKDVFREAFTPSICSLTISCCFYGNEEKARVEEKVTLENASGSVVNVTSSLCAQINLGSSPSPIT